MAAYQWTEFPDAGVYLWKQVQTSSYNTHNENGGSQNLNLNGLSDDTKLWLAPYPGGSANWKYGYTPYPTQPKNVLMQEEPTGLAAPGMLIVMSTVGELNEFFSFYLLNQRVINLGADSGNLCTNPDCYKGVVDDDVKDNNCWSMPQPDYPYYKYDWTTGEVDFLEGTFNQGPEGLVNFNIAAPWYVLLSHSPPPLPNSLTLCFFRSDRLEISNSMPKQGSNKLENDSKIDEQRWLTTLFFFVCTLCCAEQEHWVHDQWRSRSCQTGLQRQNGRRIPGPEWQKHVGRRHGQPGNNIVRFEVLFLLPPPLFPPFSHLSL